MFLVLLSDSHLFKIYIYNIIYYYIIEKLRNFGSTPDAVARCCVLEKTLNAVAHLGAKLSTRCGGPA